MPKVAAGALRRDRMHTLPFAIMFAAKRASERLPAAQTRRAIAAGEALTRELDDVIGDGVLLHPPVALELERALGGWVQPKPK